MKPAPFAALPLAALALTGCGGDGASAPADAIARCTACHSFDKGGARRTGPNLYGIIGKTAGTQSGFSYSKAMQQSGVVWTAESLDAFIAAPTKVMPGNRMAFPGESDPARRKEIIDYIQSTAAAK